MKAGKIDPSRDGFCHPPQAKRTKCACGKTQRLWSVETVCDCGRVHVREPGASAFRRGLLRPTRAGGKAGCPGVRMSAPLDQSGAGSTGGAPPNAHHVIHSGEGGGDGAFWQPRHHAA